MTALPIFYAVLLYRKRKELAKEETKEKFISLYLGLELNESNRTVWLYPLLWMLRRSIFMAISTSLFHYPTLQFAANYALSIPYIAYLAHSNSLFEDGRRRFVEVFTEFMVMISTILLQQFLRQDLEDEAKVVITNMFLAIMAVIVLVNFAYLALTLYEQWKIYKKDEARMKQVEEHGVQPLMKFIGERFKTDVIADKDK